MKRGRARWLFRIFNKRHRHACDSPQKRKCKFSVFASWKGRTDWPLVMPTLKLQTMQPAQPSLRLRETVCLSLAISFTLAIPSLTLDGHDCPRKSSSTNVETLFEHQ